MRYSEIQIKCGSLNIYALLLLNLTSSECILCGVVAELEGFFG